MSNLYESFTDLIGNTPLLKLNKLKEHLDYHRDTIFVDNKRAPKNIYNANKLKQI